MGTVIDFPDMGMSERSGRTMVARSEPATVIILPVIRIERYSEEPSGDPQSATSSTSRRRRRRRRA